MYEFTQVHVSGLWDATPAEWLRVIVTACRVGSVITVTETTSHNPLGPRGWHGYYGTEKPGANEGAILWNGDVWEVAGSGFTTPVSKTTFALGNGKPRPQIHLTGIPLRHRASGRVVVFTVVHTPSAVEGKRGLVQKVRRSIAYTETLSGISSVRRDLRKTHKRAAFVMAGDWNVNLRLPWAKALLRTSMPGLKSSWRRFPKNGTHGPRVIDDSRHSRRLTTKGSTLLPRQSGFDHTPVATCFRFRKTKH